MDYYKNQSYYDILGVKQDASVYNIEKAKDRLKFGNSDERAPFSMWDKIDEAYKILSDPDKRKEYDKQLNNEQISSYSADDISDLSENIEDNISDISEEVKQQESSLPEQAPVIENDFDFISEFKPKEKENDSESLTGAIIVPAGMKKYKRTKLVKDNGEKEITKVNTQEMVEFENYNKKLDDEINKLLSEPHNNYRLEISKLKYENQIELLQKLLEMKLSKKVKKTELLGFKLDIVATKMQLETAKKNLSNIQTKINEYEKEQGLSKVNKELIKVNKQIAEKKDSKTFSLRKLEVYQSVLLKVRDTMGKAKKTIVIKNAKVYDSFVRAKDFLKSLPYVFKSAEKIDEFISEGNQIKR